MGKVKLTIFTPVYNREKTLRRLYISLTQQTCKDFEWLVVNDGSADDSEQLIKQFIAEGNDFPINYYHKENGGKHRAINYGVERAKGELFFIVDSDDWLAVDAAETLLRYYHQIETNPQFAGVAGTRSNSKGKISGKTFQGDYLDATSLERVRYGIIGEKSEAFKTCVLKKYKFPEFDGEKFISEAVVWNKIAHDGFMLRWFNHPIYYWEYQSDGLTSNLRKLYYNNPQGYLMYVAQEMEFLKTPLLKRAMLLGRCKRTLRGTEYTGKKIMRALGLTWAELMLSNMLFPLYSKVRRLK